MRGFVILLFLAIFMTACSLSDAKVQPTMSVIPGPTAIPAGLQRVEVRTIVVKMVEQPSNRDRDFVVIRLDGTYGVYYNLNSCITDDRPYLYGPYNSIRHCVIDEPSILNGLVNDQAWLDEDLTPFRDYLSCINGWVYLGVDQQAQESWFIEIFGFPAFCR